eukprot:15444494-Alexandrium_andersonii.AAC.1
MERMCTLTNQCPVCLATFTSRRAAVAHVGGYVRTGRCSSRLSPFSPLVVVPHELRCRVCDEEFGELGEYQWHARAHLEAARAAREGVGEGPCDGGGASFGSGLG